MREVKNMYCKYCGAQIDDDSVICPNCGKQVGSTQTKTGPASENFNADSDNGSSSSISVEQIFGKNINGKNKILCGILAVLLGDFGIQFFYLDNKARGILAAIFFWTGIPAIIGLIQGIIILCESDKDFADRVERNKK